MRAYRRLTFDIPLFLATLALVTIGIVMVFSSSGYVAEETHHQMAYFLIQQVTGAAAGFLVVFLLLAVKKSFYLQPFFIFTFLAVSGLLLTLCLAMPSVAHTNRWISFPVSASSRRNWPSSVSSSFSPGSARRGRIG